MKNIRYNPVLTTLIKLNFITMKELENYSINKPLKQAVYCETQEEWDFACDKYDKITCVKAQFGKEYNTFSYTSSFRGWSTKEYYIKENYQILSFQEWCDLNGYKMENEVKFEVGKWYKAYYAERIYFLKYKNTIPRNGYNQINYSEFINNGVYRANDSISNTDLENSFKVLDDLEEIQQYLPNDHPDKIKSDIKFEVGDWVVNLERSMSYNVNEICRVSKINKTQLACEKKPQDVAYMKTFDKFRHATPEEINNHLISIGLIPAEKYPFKRLEEDDLTWEIKTEGIRWTEPVPMTNENWKPKIILSTDDEELPMVNIIKTNTIKQLLTVE